MSSPVQIVGAGIAGLACAIACRQLGLPVTIFEQADGPRPEGAGIQLSPNAVRILNNLGLAAGLQEFAVAPRAIRLRDLRTGASLACLPAGPDFVARFGQPTLTIRRVDLQAVLLDRAKSLNTSIVWNHHAMATVAEQHEHGNMGAWVGADGVWSELRSAVPNAQPPTPTGQAAIRGLLHVCPNPKSEMGREITVWCGQGAHLVGYPLGRHESYGFVLIHPALPGMAEGWSSPVPTTALDPIVSTCNRVLRDILCSVDDWRGWPLYAAAPLPGPQALHAGNVALIGDAGHAMRPHLAQGAAMGLEDAWTLARCLQEAGPRRVDRAMARFAAERWQRVRQVQQRAERSGRIFQLGGLIGLARNLALRLHGPQLMDQAWLWADPFSTPSRPGNRALND
ncbi:MAG: FAD-dependent monooxygenase [Burkholderiaceae bacterium]